MPKLKVYGGMVEGQHRAIIATTSAQKVVDALCAAGEYTTLYHVSTHWTVTGNAAEITAATAQPGVLLVERIPWSKQFVPYEPRRK